METHVRLLPPSKPELSMFLTTLMSWFFLWKAILYGADLLLNVYLRR
jgi:hypothetical protein